MSGATPKSEIPEYWDGDIPWITPADYKTKDKYVSSGKKSLTQAGYDSCGTTFIPKGSIIFSKRAPVGTVAIAKNGLCTNQGCLSCVLKDNSDCVYYYYAMSAFTKEFELVSTGTTFKEIAADVFSNFSLPAPSVDEQHRIAQLLDDECARIDAVIERTRASIEEYKKLKQAVITQAVTKGIHPNRPMKDSGIDCIGMIPATWSICKIKYLLSRDKVNLRVGPFGSSLSGLDFITEGVWVYNQRVVLDNCFTQNNTFISEEKFAELKNFEVIPGDYLITTRGSIGRVAVVPEKAPKGVLHPCIIKFRLNPEMVSRSIILHIFNNTDIVMRQIKNMSNSTTIDVLYSYSLKNIKIPLIPKEELIEIEEYVKEISAEYDQMLNKKQSLICELENYKKSLIFEYVTGKKL